MLYGMASTLFVCGTGILSVFASCCMSLLSLTCLDSHPPLTGVKLWKNILYQSSLKYLYCAYRPTR